MVIENNIAVVHINQPVIMVANMQAQQYVSMFITQRVHRMLILVQRVSQNTWNMAKGHGVGKKGTRCCPKTDSGQITTHLLSVSAGCDGI